MKGTLVSAKFMTLGNYFSHFYEVLADNNRGVTRKNYVVTDTNFKNPYLLQY